MLTEKDKRAVYNCVRECLWIARVWNDHNFKPEVIREKIMQVVEPFACDNALQGNSLLCELEAFLEDTK